MYDTSTIYWRRLYQYTFFFFSPLQISAHSSVPSISIIVPEPPTMGAGPHWPLTLAGAKPLALVAASFPIFAIALSFALGDVLAFPALAYCALCRPKPKLATHSSYSSFSCFSSSPLSTSIRKT